MPLPRRRRLPPRARRAVIVGATVVSMVMLVSCTPAPRPPAPGATATSPATPRQAEPTVVVYGDSLTFEANRYIPALAAQFHLHVSVHAYIGTAICDWFDDMVHRLPAAHPAVVVDAFYGNSFTRCMRDSRGNDLRGAATAAKYRRDARAAAAIAIAADANVVFVGAPRARAQMASTHWQAVRYQYRVIAARYPGRVVFADSGTDIAPNNTFAAKLPCLPRERALVDPDGTRPCVNGRVVVRAPDGLHFCPRGLDSARLDPGGCAGYMSGAYRYAREIVEQARAAAGARRPGGPLR